MPFRYVMLTLVVALPMLVGCRWFRPSAPERPGDERALMLVHVDPGEPAAGDGSSAELRDEAAVYMREQMAKWLGRRGWWVRYIEERIDLAEHPGVYLVSIELRVVDPGNTGAAGVANAVRTVGAGVPVVGSTSRRVRHDNSAYCAIHYELQRSNQVVDTGEVEDRDSDGWEDVLRHMAIDLADPLTERAGEVDAQ